MFTPMEMMDLIDTLTHEKRELEAERNKLERLAMLARVIADLERRRIGAFDDYIKVQDKVDDLDRECQRLKGLLESSGIEKTNVIQFAPVDEPPLFREPS
jgi:hypothetical protein